MSILEFIALQSHCQLYSIILIVRLHPPPLGILTTRFSRRCAPSHLPLVQSDTARAARHSARAARNDSEAHASRHQFTRPGTHRTRPGIQRARPGIHMARHEAREARRPAHAAGIQRALMRLYERERVYFTDRVRERMCVPGWTVGTSALQLLYSRTAQYC